MSIIMRAKPIVDFETPRIAARILDLKAKFGRAPKLVVVHIGNHAASEIYVKRKLKSAQEVGMDAELLSFSEDVAPSIVLEEVEKLNQSPLVDGILIQRPLPTQFSNDEVLKWVVPEKDVDGLHPDNQAGVEGGTAKFVACTPKGVMKMLEFYKIPIQGVRATVIGRSAIVGKPVAGLLRRAGAHVDVIHRQVTNPKELARNATILVVAAGQDGMITSEWVNPNSVVIDVGIHRRADGKIVGDVAYAEVEPIVHAISPVPGGVGPLTILCLLENCVESFHAQKNAAL